jgi:CheY-like chemotaxis protein
MPAEVILIVDDNEMNIKLVSLTLAAAGYMLLAATCASEVYSILERERPHLILMDLQLPGIDGYELTRRLKGDTRTRDIVIVALTAQALDDVSHAARDAGCDGYISKPIDTRAFPDIVGRYLRSQSSMRI